MALRTYLPKLLFILRLLCGYIGRNRERIEHFIGEENIAALDAVVTACEALEAILEVIVPVGS